MRFQWLLFNPETDICTNSIRDSIFQVSCFSWVFFFFFSVVRPIPPPRTEVPVCFLVAAVMKHVFNLKPHEDVIWPKTRFFKRC